MKSVAWFLFALMSVVFVLDSFAHAGRFDGLVDAWRGAARADPPAPTPAAPARAADDAPVPGESSFTPLSPRVSEPAPYNPTLRETFEPNARGPLTDTFNRQ